MGSTKGSYIWFKGEIMPEEKGVIPVRSVSTAAIAAVFEGIRGYWNAEQNQMYVFRLDDHLARLAQSMKLMRMEVVYSQRELKEVAVELVRRNNLREDCYIHPVAFYTQRQVGKFNANTPPDMLIDISPIWSYLKTDHQMSCCVSSWTRIADNTMPPRIKCLSNYQNARLAYLLANADGYDGAIFLNSLGKVAEGTGACLFIARHRKLITPPVTGDILESITRETVITLAREILGVEVVERTVDRTELYVADEAFFCGTGAEITPITSIDHYTVGDGQIGSLTVELENLYHDLVRGIDGRYAEWRTPIYGS